MIPLLTFRSRRSVVNFIRSPPVYARRTVHASSARRGGIFRNAEGRWSASTGTIVGTLTFREIFALLSGLLAIYMLCRVRDAEKKCGEFEARARSFLVRGIEERRKAVMILIAARVFLQQKEKEAEQEGKSFNEREARLKAETLKVLERQEKFLNDLDAGEPVEISPGYGLRKTR